MTADPYAPFRQFCEDLVRSGSLRSVARWNEPVCIAPDCTRETIDDAYGTVCGEHWAVVPDIVRRHFLGALLDQRWDLLGRWCNVLRLIWRAQPSEERGPG